MSTMISEVYDALKEAGASEDKARKAAEAIADYENHFAKIEQELNAFRGEVKAALAQILGEIRTEMAQMKGALKADIAQLRGDNALMKWMLGFVLAIGVALIFKAYT